MILITSYSIDLTCTYDDLFTDAERIWCRGIVTATRLQVQGLCTIGSTSPGLTLICLGKLFGLHL